MDHRQKQALRDAAVELAESIKAIELADLLKLAKLVNKDKIEDIFTNADSNYVRNLRLIDAVRESDSTDAYVTFRDILERIDPNAPKLLNSTDSHIKDKQGIRSILDEMYEKYGKSPTGQYPLGMKSSMSSSSTPNSFRSTSQSSTYLYSDSATISSPLKETHRATLITSGSNSPRSSDTTAVDNGFVLARRYPDGHLPVVDKTPDNSTRSRANNDKFVQTPSRAHELNSINNLSISEENSSDNEGPIWRPYEVTASGTGSPRSVSPHYCNPTYSSASSESGESTSDSHIVIKDSEAANTIAREGSHNLSVKPATVCHNNQNEDYKMTARPRGKCLIMNNIDFEFDIFPTRKGSDEDANRFDRLFQQLGFETIMTRNLTAEQMKHIFKDLAAACKPEHDALFVIILSHGSEKGIYGTDGIEVHLDDDIISCFDNRNCKAMLGKPKVFVIQACRGRAKDFGGDGDTTDSIAWPSVTVSPAVKSISQENRVPTSLLPSQPLNGKKRKHPIRTDMLLIFSCLAGFVSVRNELAGSWLGVTLAYFMFEHAHERDLLRILNLVTSDIIQRESTHGHIQSIELKLLGWTKNLYFNPGQKHLFPLKNFEDVEKLFQYNLDRNNGEPNLTLLSIVVGLIEHSLVTISDKDDLANNLRPIEQRSSVVGRNSVINRLINSFSSSTSSHHQHLSSTSTTNDLNKDTHQSNNQIDHQQHNHHSSHSKANPSETEFNEAGYVSSADSDRSPCSSPVPTANDNLTIPEIEFEIVETLYRKFVDQIKVTIDFKETDGVSTNLKIKRISDSVWEHLSNSYYKDKAHLQSIFSYLTTNKLDCFGLAFAVISGCQILNLKNIYLALSEDHAWVMFDLTPEEMNSHTRQRELKEYTDNDLPIPTCALYGTCEVTWHGKANSDKRGQPVVYKNCWLYTNGYAVKCDIRLCVAALINSINPSINSNTDSETLALLQQRLLWLLFNEKIYFPMSLGNLGELENLNPTPNAPLTAHELFNLGVEISRTDYNDAHVYPYSYLASFFFNNGRFKEALETWADASAVMTKYQYSRSDEEIYNEFLEVANELIPSMLKVLTAGSLEPGGVSLKPFLQDPECLALILKLYDNICCWEEGSSTPVLHIGWARKFVATVLKFSSIIRLKIKLLTEEEWNQNKACASECEVSSRADQCSSTAGDHYDNNYNETADKSTKNGKVKKEEEDEAGASDCKTSKKRAHSCDDKVNTSESSTSKLKLNDGHVSSVPGGQSNDTKSLDRTNGKLKRENRLEFDTENNVTVILRSRKIAGVRDLLQAERLNKTAIELQLTAQSQCAVRGRSNSSSYSSEFISTTLTSIGSSTRSKRSHR